MALSSKLRLWLIQSIANKALSTELADAIDANTTAGAGNTAAIATKLATASFTDAAVSGKLLTGFATAVANAAVLATDSILLAFGKVQKQLDDIVAKGGQDTTGTGASVGQVAVAALTSATGKVVVTCAEDPGATLILSDVVVSDGYFTVWTKATDTGARAALDSKLVNFYIISL